MNAYPLETPASYLDEFFRAYMVAALWSSYDDEGEPLDASADICDIAPETQETMRADCARFIAENSAGLLAYARARGLPLSAAMGAAGHDFWLTRNGHGAGFWARGAGNVGDLLTDASRAFPEVDLYLGDDGKVHA